MIYEDSINLLGKKAKDKITGSVGVIISVCFDLFGCIQVILNPGRIDKDGKEIPTIGWIDINRLTIKNEKRVMEHPDFNVKYNNIKSVHGPAAKPII